jgi:hypothetical protein
MHPKFGQRGWLETHRVPAHQFVSGEQMLSAVPRLCRISHLVIPSTTLNIAFHQNMLPMITHEVVSFQIVLIWRNIDFFSEKVTNDGKP